MIQLTSFILSELSGDNNFKYGDNNSSGDNNFEYGDNNLSEDDNFKYGFKIDVAYDT